MELYPTLEIAPAMPRTQAFLAHNAIPVQYTQEDFDQVLSGNFVTKVIYLPDDEYQEMALAGIEELVSTRLPMLCATRSTLVAPRRVATSSRNSTQCGVVHSALVQSVA